jgi:hypothetical protein
MFFPWKKKTTHNIACFHPWQILRGKTEIHERIFRDALETIRVGGADAGFVNA